MDNGNMADIVILLGIYFYHTPAYLQNIINGWKVSTSSNSDLNLLSSTPDQKSIKHKPPNNSSGCHPCRRSWENTTGANIKQSGTQINLALALQLIIKTIISEFWEKVMEIYVWIRHCNYSILGNSRWVIIFPKSFLACKCM